MGQFTRKDIRSRCGRVQAIEAIDLEAQNGAPAPAFDAAPGSGV